MDRLRQKGKKDKSSFIADVKSIKENLKIKEILRNVKINSSMRIKGRPGSKIMDNKDFNDNDDLFEESSTTEGDQEECKLDAPSATNLNVIFDNLNVESSTESIINTDVNVNTDIDETSQTNEKLDMSENQCKTDLEIQSTDPENLGDQRDEADQTDIQPEHESNAQCAKQCNSSALFQSDNNVQLDEQSEILIKEQSESSAEKESETDQTEQCKTEPSDNLEQVPKKEEEIVKKETSGEQIKEPFREDPENPSRYKEEFQKEYDEKIIELNNEQIVVEKIPEGQCNAQNKKQPIQIEQEIEPEKLHQEKCEEKPEDKLIEQPQVNLKDHTEENLKEPLQEESIEASEQQRKQGIVECGETYLEKCTEQPTVQSANELKEESEQQAKEQSEEHSKKPVEGESKDQSDELDKKESHIVENQYNEEDLKESAVQLRELEEQVLVPTQQSEGQLKETSEEDLKVDPDEQLKMHPEEPHKEQSEEQLEETQKHSEEQSKTTTDCIADKSNIKDVFDRQMSTDVPIVKTRDRKLSLDQTMLTRREGLSQSEVDLLSIGKLPLERKSSFFRKKMDSFLRNTTELFKKQSFNSKPQAVHRRGSISVSLQSLNESSSGISSTSDFNETLLHTDQEESRSSMTSLNSSLTLGRSSSNESLCRSDVLNTMQGSEQSLASSQPTIHVTHALGDYPSNSVHSLNESLLHDSLLHNRAISMGSGLDSQTRLRRKKSSSSSWSKRVTWVASEGVTNYFRRMIKDENASNIPEDQVPLDNAALRTTDKSKGRRLSYQRAVSGEDPTKSKYQDSKRRTDHSEPHPELSHLLAEYMESGVPELRGFEKAHIDPLALDTLEWAQDNKNIDEFLRIEGSSKQAVICELVSTEADYLRHLQVLVEVFMATAHALQDKGMMLGVTTDQIFFNIPDVYNANLKFWEATFHPMLRSAFENNTPFDLQLMEPGFSKIAEFFIPYEFYAIHQPRAHVYIRSLAGNTEFGSYLFWCHGHQSCQRLQITDLLMKPIQRVTKYNLILKRILNLVDDETERRVLSAMDHTVKTYVTELNRSVKQRQEEQKAQYYAKKIEPYEADFLQVIFQEFKDDEMDEYYFRMFSQSNLRAPMLNCHSQHARTVVHEGDLRFKDSNKEIEVRAILFTDMLIICKKQSKGSPYEYKMIRPKYMIDKLIEFPKHAVRNNSLEIAYILIVMVDELGSCHTCFTLSESSKDPNGSETLKLWEQKIKEAQYTYNLAVWLNSNPSYHIGELDQELAEYGSSSAKQSDLLNQRQLSQEDYNIEREAKERVVTMMHRIYNPSFTTDQSPSHLSILSDMASMNITGKDPLLIPMGRKVPGIDVLRNRWKRPSTGCSTINSRLSSFQKSTSGTSQDEYQPGSREHIYRTGSSVEHTITQFSVDDDSSIEMSVMRKSDSELELDSTYNTPSITRLSSLSPSRQNSLQVENTVVALVHSLPDLSLVGPPRSARRSPSPISASEQLYKSHQELLKSRLNVQSQSRAGRGSSYLLSSPIGSSLRKGLAFSSSFQRPSLLGTGHVASQGNIDKVQSEPHTISIPVPRKMPSQTPSQEPTAGPSKEKDDSSRSVAKFLQGGYSQEELEKMRKQDEIAKLKAERLRNAHKARTRYLRQAARNA